MHCNGKGIVQRHLSLQSIHHTNQVSEDVDMNRKLNCKYKGAKRTCRNCLGVGQVQNSFPSMSSGEFQPTWIDRQYLHKFAASNWNDTYQYASIRSSRIRSIFWREEGHFGQVRNVDVTFQLSIRKLDYHKVMSNSGCTQSTGIPRKAAGLLSEFSYANFTAIARM